MGPLGVRANSRVWLPSGSVWPWKVQGLGSGSQYVLIDFGTHSSVFLRNCVISLTLDSLPLRWGKELYYGA